MRATKQIWILVVLLIASGAILLLNQKFSRRISQPIHRVALELDVVETGAEILRPSGSGRLIFEARSAPPCRIPIRISFTGPREDYYRQFHATQLSHFESSPSGGTARPVGVFTSEIRRMTPDLRQRFSVRLSDLLGGYRTAVSPQGGGPVFINEGNYYFHTGVESGVGLADLRVNMQRGPENAKEPRPALCRHVEEGVEFEADSALPH